MNFPESGGRKSLVIGQLISTGCGSIRVSYRASWSIVEHRGAANMPEIDQGKRKSDNYQSETELGWGRVGGKVGGREEEQEEEEQEEEIVQECSRVECLTAQLHGVPNKGKRKRDNDE